MAPELEHLEKSSHFYHRGRDTTRLEAFVDAAFAFALTLLVISFDAVPQSFEALTTALKAVPAFLMASAYLQFSGLHTASGRFASGWTPRSRRSSAWHWCSSSLSMFFHCAQWRPPR